MARIAGADGCPGGWLVVSRDLAGGALRVDRVVDLRVVLDRSDGPDVLCVDVPIGLLDQAVRGGRECDRLARRLLGPSRGSSVFPPPVRPALAASCYEDACRANRESSPHGLGISQQCFGIFGKIREVDEIITPDMQGRVIEVHPEVSFCELNEGRPLAAGKKVRDGRHERLDLLRTTWGRSVAHLVESRPRPSNADDVIDAMVACWTAERVFQGIEQRLPAVPVFDSRGLRMEIVR